MVTAFCWTPEHVNARFISHAPFSAAPGHSGTRRSRKRETGRKHAKSARARAQVACIRLTRSNRLENKSRYSSANFAGQSTLARSARAARNIKRLVLIRFLIKLGNINASFSFFLHEFDARLQTLHSPHQLRNQIGIFVLGLASRHNGIS